MHEFVDNILSQVTLGNEAFIIVNAFSPVYNLHNAVLP